MRWREGKTTTKGQHMGDDYDNTYVPPPPHRWKLPGNYPVFTVVMVIYHYVEIIWRIIVTPNFLYNINNHE